MALQAFSRIRELDARCPGLIQTIDAMFESFANIEAVTQMVRAKSGERISHTTLWRYKRQFWNVRRHRDEATRAKLIALQTEANERRF
jgi:hypothetical protein